MVHAKFSSDLSPPWSARNSDDVEIALRERPSRALPRDYGGTGWESGVIMLHVSSPRGALGVGTQRCPPGRNPASKEKVQSGEALRDLGDFVTRISTI